MLASRCDTRHAMMRGAAETHSNRSSATRSPARIPGRKIEASATARLRGLHGELVLVVSGRFGEIAPQPRTSSLLTQEPTTRRRKPIAYPHSITVRMSDHYLRKLNHCSDVDGVARAILCRRFIEQHLDRCCPEPE